MLMKTHNRIIHGLLLTALWVGMAAGADDKKSRTGDAGLGYAISSDGQSLFYMRGTAPFKTNHWYLSLGMHMEEQGIAIGVYDYYTGRIERNPTQSYYLETGGGFRHLWLRKKMAGRFFPHTSVEVGAAGYVARFGHLKKWMKDSALVWSPYIQIGSGASIFGNGAIYRVEVGYLQTLSLLSEQKFPPYKGVYIKIVVSSGQKPR